MNNNESHNGPYVETPKAIINFAGTEVAVSAEEKHIALKYTGEQAEKRAAELKPLLEKFLAERGYEVASSVRHGADASLYTHKKDEGFSKEGSAQRTAGRVAAVDAFFKHFAQTSSEKEYKQARLQLEILLKTSINPHLPKPFSWQDKYPSRASANGYANGNGNGKSITLSEY